MDGSNKTSGAAGAPPATDPAVAQAGTAAQASQGTEKPVVIGAADRPIEPGGPGVGAARLARETEGFATRPLTEGAATDLELRPLTEREREELARLRRPPSEREELEALRRVRGAGVTIDAADVRGVRLARAATTIKRDGTVYAPGTAQDWVPLDFAGYTELVQIGAITDTPWPELEPVGES